MTVQHYVRARAWRVLSRRGERVCSERALGASERKMIFHVTRCWPQLMRCRNHINAETAVRMLGTEVLVRFVGHATGIAVVAYWPNHAIPLRPQSVMRSEAPQRVGQSELRRMHQASPVGITRVCHVGPRPIPAVPGILRICPPPSRRPRYESTRSRSRRASTPLRAESPIGCSH